MLVGAGCNFNFALRRALLEVPVRTVKTCNLKDADLCWAVQEAEFRRMETYGGYIKQWALDQHKQGFAAFSAFWSNFGEILEFERISVKAEEFDDTWAAQGPDGSIYTASTALEAAMRAYVGIVIGEEVNLPHEVTDDLEEFVDRNPR